MVPHRLDLTVSVLRRLSKNVVDVLTAEGHYLRALDGTSGPAVVRVEQPDPRTLTVSIEGDADDQGGMLALVGRMLGVDRDVTHFERAAATVPWLSPLALRMHGVKPPRYSTLWEAFVNVIAFQQLSLQAAIAIVRRLIMAFGRSLESDGVPLYTFPSAEEVLECRAQSRARRGVRLPSAFASVLDALQPQQGMLYYHLLLARLEARGEVGGASVSGGDLHDYRDRAARFETIGEITRSGNANLVSLVLVECHR